MKPANWPISMLWPITNLPPNQRTATMQRYIQSCMIGMFRITNFSAESCASLTASALPLNFSLS